MQRLYRVTGFLEGATLLTCCEIPEFDNQDLRNPPRRPPMNKCFSPYPSLLLGGNEGGGGNRTFLPQSWGIGGAKRHYLRKS